MDVACADVLVLLMVVVATELPDCSANNKLEWIPSVEATKRYVAPFVSNVVSSPRDSDRVSVEPSDGFVDVA